MEGEGGAERPSFEEAVEALADRMRSLDIPIRQIEDFDADQRRAEGWTKSPQGDWVPPGYGPLPGASGALSTGEEAALWADTPRDSV